MGKVETKDDPSTDEKTEKATKVHLKNRYCWYSKCFYSILQPKEQILS